MFFMYEWKKIIESKISIIIGVILILPIVMNNPLILKNSFGGGIIDFINDFRMISIFSIPLVVSVSFDENISKAENYPIFTQPIALYKIICTKLSVVWALYIVGGLIGSFFYGLSMKFASSCCSEILLLFKQFVFVNIPIIILMSLFSALIYSTVNNLVILYISVFFGILLIGNCTPYFDFTLKNKEYQTLFMDNTIVQSYMFNRMCTLIEIVVLFSLLLLVYRNKVKKKIVSRGSIRKIRQFGITKKIFGKELAIVSPHITSFLVVILLFFIFSVLEKSASSWEFTQYLLILLAGLMIIPSISEIYENKRIGYVLTGSIPRLKFWLKRVLGGIVKYWIICILIFGIAYGVRIETDFKRVFIVLIGGTFLSMLGLVFSCYTKRTVAGYAAMILSWAIFIIGGSVFSEKLWFLSIPLALSTHVMILWETLASVSIISSLLFLISTYIVCRKEMVSKYLVGVCVLIIGINAIYLWPISNSENRYFTKDNEVIEEKIGNFKVKYNKKIPQNSVIDISKTYGFLEKIYSEFFSSFDSKRELCILTDEQVKLERCSKFFSYSTLNDFNPPKFSTMDNYFLSISDNIMNNYGIEKKELPEEIYTGIRGYLLYGKACAYLDEITTEMYREKYYIDVLSPEYSSYYKEKVNKSDAEEDKMAKVLFSIEEKYGISKVKEVLDSLAQNEGKILSTVEIIERIAGITGDNNICQPLS